MYSDGLWNKLSAKQRVLIADSIVKKKSVLVIGQDTESVSSFTTLLLSKFLEIDDLFIYKGSATKDVRQLMMYDPATMGILATSSSMYKLLIDYLRHGGSGMFGIIADSVDSGLSNVVNTVLIMNQDPIEKASLAYELGQYIDFVIDITKLNTIEVYKYNGYTINTIAI